MSKAKALDNDQEKKARKIFYGVAKYAGLSGGLLILALVTPLISDSPNGAALREIFVIYSIYMAVFVAVMIGIYFFMRKQIFGMNIFMQWVILPTVGLMFVVDGYKAITSAPAMPLETTTQQVEKAYVPESAEENKWGIGEMVIDE